MVRRAKLTDEDRERAAVARKTHRLLPRACGDYLTIPLTDAQRQLVDQNRGLAYLAARRVYKQLESMSHWGTEEDAIQQALLCLCKCARAYDPEIAKFSTYAYRAICHDLTNRSLEGGKIRIPNHALDRRSKHNEQAQKVLAVCKLPAKFDRMIPGSDEEPAINYEVGEAISRLPDKLRNILVWYFWYGETYQAIGKRIGVTRERVRQLRNDGLAMIRERLGE